MALYWFDPFVGKSKSVSGTGGNSERVRYTIEKVNENNKDVFKLKQTINGATTYVGVPISFNTDEITYNNNNVNNVTEALDYLYSHADSNCNSITDINFTSSSKGSQPNLEGATDTYTISYSDNTTETFSLYNGVDGLSVVSADFNTQNELIFTLSDDSTINAGVVPNSQTGETIDLSNYVEKTEYLSTKQDFETRIANLENTIGDIQTILSTLVTVEGGA